MATIKKDGNFMSLPMNIVRGNPIPLDSSEIWYDKQLMENYAKTGPTSYVGQILGLVDEIHNSAKAYIILNKNGDLQEVGAATVVDNNSIVLNEKGQVALKDFGKVYYRYVEATQEEPIKPAHYEKQIVDEGHPWKSGLEPRVVLDEGNLVIGWYEPNPTTIEGVNDAVTALQNKIENVYTKEETNTEINNAVAKAGHLSRKKVNSVDEILTSVPQEDLEKYIFMVPAVAGETNDKYDEYLVIEGVVEKIGSWEVNLSDYATKEDLKLKADASALEEVRKTAVAALPKATFDNFISVEPDTVGNLKEWISTNRDSTSGLISVADQEKLTNIKAPVITSVDEANFTISDGKLLLDDIPVAKITNLAELLNNKVDKVEGSRLITSQEVTALEKVTKGELDNYIKSVAPHFTVNEVGQLSLNAIPSDIVIPQVGNLTDLTNYSSDTNIVNEINNIYELLAWGDIQAPII